MVIDLTAAFDTECHNTLISKIAGLSLPHTITRWLSCNLRGRQAATSFRCIKSSTRIVCTGVLQWSNSPSLFNYYIADIPKPTPPVKRVCYADDMTVWASGPKIPQLESMINSYLRDVCIYLKENSLLNSAPKATLFTPDTHQFQAHPKITREDTQLPPTPPQPKHRHTPYTRHVPTGLVNPKLNLLSHSPPYLLPRPEPHSYTFHTLHPHLSLHTHL